MKLKNPIMEFEKTLNFAWRCQFRKEHAKSKENENKNPNMEFEKTLNLLNVVHQNLKIIVRCSDTPKLSAYYKQLLDKMVNAE